MPLPLGFIAFVLGSAIGYFVNQLIYPDPLADGEPPPDDPRRPRPIDPDNPPDNPNEPYDPNPVRPPIIWFPPDSPYNPDLNPDSPTIELPPSRLPIEGDGQTEIQTELGDVFTIQEWIQYREFGSLLCNPFVNEPLIITQGFNLDADQRFQEAVFKGTQNYQRWLQARLDPEYRKSDEYIDAYSFWDGTAWVMPQRLKGLQGDLGVNFGVHALQELGKVMSLQSKNCLFGVIDNIPNGWEVRAIPFPETELLSHRLDNLEIIGDQQTQELLGVTRFPITVPKDLTKLPTFEEMMEDGIFERSLDQASFDSTDPDKLNKEIENLTPEQIEENMSPQFKQKYYDTVNDLTEFISWQMRQLDGLLGAYPINIEVEDNDLTTEGNQPLSINIPNIAEGLAELIGNMVTQEKVTNAMIDMQIRLLMEIASNKKMAAVTSLGVDSIVDYLGYKIAKKETDINYSFNPGANLETEQEVDFVQFLKPTDIQISYNDYDDDTTLEMQLQQLIESARIIKAKNTRKVNLDDLSSLKSLFTSALKMVENSDDDELKSKFDEWLTEFEDGFTNRSDIRDPSRPWGRDRSQRPRINKLNKNDS